MLDFRYNLHSLSFVFIFKRIIQTHKFSQNHPNTPDISLERVLESFSYSVIEHLGTHIKLCSHLCVPLSFGCLLLSFSFTEVSKLNDVILTHEEVFRFEISMHDVKLVDLIYCSAYLISVAQEFLR